MVKHYFAQNEDLFARLEQDNIPVIKPWKPVALSHQQWPPDYRAVYAWRIETLKKLRGNPELLASAKAYYSTHKSEFIMHWMDTYDPRRKGSKWIPFVFFKRQEEYIHFIEECVRDDENGITEKCRDVGATWLSGACSVHDWLFVPNDAIGWGSRKQELVDKLGDLSSIFEKLRMLVRRLPDIFKPVGLVESKHLTFMKMLNPENGAVITGETGDNIGRGGRTRYYMKDESSHYARPELIQAALDDNTRVQLDISSVNGLGNVFHKKAKAAMEWRPGAVIPKGFTRKFIFDWRNHPEKDQAWYDMRRGKAEREGLQHIFAQEVDRNYSAAISNTIINMLWIQTAVDAHKRIKWKDARGVIHVGIPDQLLAGNWSAGLDVADEGMDRNALALRQGIVWRDVEEWGERDPGVTTRRTIMKCRAHRGIVVQYDSIGIGSAVKSEYNRLVTDEKILLPDEVKLVGWNAGASVQWPYYRIIPDDEQSALNKDFFHNFKAQAWWSLRTRFYKTWNNITNGVLYPIDELISLDSTMELLQSLMDELAQPTSSPSTSSLRMVVEKKPDGTKSPNLGDAGVMMFFPVIEGGGASIGEYGF